MEKLITALGPNDPDDGDEGRRQRGLAIAALADIRPDRFGFRVPSQSDYGNYEVTLEDGGYCTCPDYEKRGKDCKHVYAVRIYVQREEHDDGSTTDTIHAVGYQRPWSAYTAAQVNEGRMFASILREICDTVPQPLQTTGRPRLPIGDTLYGMGLKVYGGKSTRRAMSEIRDAVDAGRMTVAPSFVTTIRNFEREDVTPVLSSLVQGSAIPLSGIERYFAIDSTGFSSSTYGRWFDHKWGKGGKKAGGKMDWVKLHGMVGVDTKIVTAAEVDVAYSADSPRLPGLVQATAANFHMLGVSGDKAYLSKRNLNAIVDVGAWPFILFKKDSAAVATEPKDRDPVWTKMFHYVQAHREEFEAYYHQRSNVETAFHMVKAKFGGFVRTKTHTARVNEVLTKVLCHNIVVLVNAFYTLGVVPSFGEAAPLLIPRH